MVKGLVLAGGGTRGSYEYGAVKALVELKQDDWKIVTGTSIGALNALFVVYRDYDLMAKMWDHIKKEDIIFGAVENFDLGSLMSEKETVKQFVYQYFKDKGADITPLRKRIYDNFFEERFLESDIDYGCIAVHLKSRKPVFVDKEMIVHGSKEWLVATASAFPAFPVCEIDGQGYVDGGYYDNLPIDYCMRKGADEIIAIDLNHVPQHMQYLHKENIHYIYPKVETGGFLDFDNVLNERLKVLGYNDVMKEFGRYMGYKYTFEPFELPKWFDRYYLHMMLLETKIKEESELGSVFRSCMYIEDHVMSVQYKKVLSKQDLFFGLLDSLLDVLDVKLESVYRYEEVEGLLLDVFVGPNFLQYVESSDFLETTKKVEKIGVIRKLVGMGLIDDDTSVMMRKFALCVHPYEKALADFVWFMKEENDEKSCEV